MTLTKVKEIQEPHFIAKVEDYMTKKQFFADSETVGWIFFPKEDKVEVFHLYRRGWDNESNVSFDEDCFFSNEPLEGEELAIAIEQFKNEVSLHDNIFDEETKDFITSTY